MIAGTEEFWVLQDGEPLPIDDGERLYRTGLVASQLVRLGRAVRWFAPRFSHQHKIMRARADERIEAVPGLVLELMRGRPYTRNVSFSRVLHQREMGAEFLRRAARLPPPALVFAGYPSPELCRAGARFAAAHGVPLALDIRDPWPDIMYDYMPSLVRPIARLYLARYRSMLAESVRASRAVFASSAYNLKWALEIAGLSQRPADANVYHAYASPVPADTDEKSDGLACVFVGSLGHSYDIGVIIEAAKRLAAAGESRISIRIIGDGERRSHWEQQAASVSKIVFTGWLNKVELERELSRAHVGLLTVHGGTARFTVPNKLGEYLAASLCVVNTTPGETSEIVAAEGVGVNVTPDAEALANALIALAEDRNRLYAVMKRSAEVFREKFWAELSYRGFAERLIALGEQSSVSRLGPLTPTRQHGG